MSFNLTVFFEDPFWVGLFAITEGDSGQYCRVVFGKEPSVQEVYDFLNKHYRSLVFSEILPFIPEVTVDKNPQRRQREAGKMLHTRLGEKKSYLAIKESLQQSQRTSQKAAQKRREAENEVHIFQVKQTKKKRKHRGH